MGPLPFLKGKRMPISLMPASKTITTLQEPRFSTRNELWDDSGSANVDLTHFRAMEGRRPTVILPIGKFLEKMVKGMGGAYGFRWLPLKISLSLCA